MGTREPTSRAHHPARPVLAIDSYRRSEHLLRAVATCYLQSDQEILPDCSFVEEALRERGDERNLDNQSEKRFDGSDTRFPAA